MNYERERAMYEQDCTEAMIRMRDPDKAVVPSLQKYGKTVMNHSRSLWNNRTADETLIVDCHGAEIAQVLGDYNEDYERMSANARLIAAAPDLAKVLERYMFAYPAFRMKPEGAPGSQARVEQERLMELEDCARAALAKAGVA